MPGDAHVRDDFDILILGPTPPPFGGISAHVSRLVPKLQRAGFKVGVLNHFGSTEMPFVVAALARNPLNYYRIPRKFRARIVHYHHSGWLNLLALALGKGNSTAPYIITLHGSAMRKHLFQPKLPSVARITRWALRRFEIIVCVDPQIASLIRSQLDTQRLEVVPAFLEFPAYNADKYDGATQAFLDSGRVLIVAGYGVQFLPSGRELYGLDTAVEVFSELAQERRDLRLALFLARRPLRRKARRHLADLERRLEEAGVRDRVLISFERPLAPALRQGSVFLRPTRAEGDAVSVREARQAGIPVVASDVVPRPDGVISFRTEDVAELSAKLRYILDEVNDSLVETAVIDPANGGQPDFSEKLLEIYRSVLDSGS